MTLQSQLVHFDTLVANAVAAHRSAPLMQACEVTSYAGAPLTIAIMSALIGAVLIARKQYPLALFWIATLAGGGLLNRVLKEFFHRERPLGAQQYLHGVSWSFPSGHTMGSTIFFAALALLLLTRERSAGTRALVILAAMLSITLIGASRICLGVHFATDVIAAMAFGAAWFALCLIVFRRAVRH